MVKTNKNSNNQNIFAFTRTTIIHQKTPLNIVLLLPVRGETVEKWEQSFIKTITNRPKSQTEYTTQIKVSINELTQPKKRLIWLINS
jgi:hypothetical protein